MSKAIMLEPIGGDTFPYVIPEESSKEYSFEIGTDKNFYMIFAEKRDDSTGRRFCYAVGSTANAKPSYVVAFADTGFGTYSTSFYTASYIDGILTISSISASNTYFKKGVKYYYKAW